MSAGNVERRRWRRKDGTYAERFRVRWVDELGERQAETFDTEDAAVAFRDELAARAEFLRGGPAAQRQTTMALAAERWWDEHVVPNLAQRTQAGYASSWRLHVGPRLGGMLVIDVTPVVLEAFKDELLAAGVGHQSVRTALALTRSVLAHAVRRGVIHHNPAAAVRKPPARVKRRRRVPPSIAHVERMRAVAVERGSPLTAIFISIGAYGGLRPGEQRALRWCDIGERTLRVSDAVDVDGTLRGSTKTYRARAAELAPMLADDLAAWRTLTPYPADEHPVLPAADGSHLDDSGYKNFVRRKFGPIAATAGCPCSPYDLRHFAASLLVQEGRLSLQEVAGHLGHTLAELSRTYARELAEYRGVQLDVVAEVNRVRAEQSEPLRALVDQMGLAVSRALAPEHRDPRVALDTTIIQLVSLNRVGVLDDQELASKLRQIAV